VCEEREWVTLPDVAAQKGGEVEDQVMAEGVEAGGIICKKIGIGKI
jgi:hypothetical protein